MLRICFISFVIEKKNHSFMCHPCMLATKLVTFSKSTQVVIKFKPLNLKSNIIVNI
jgi:hypothetical protein